MTAIDRAGGAVRNPGIDLLRGLSILLVVLHHLGMRIPLNQGVLAVILPKRFLNALTYNGYEAVFIFFVISGFLITSNSMARWGALGNIDSVNFYIRRSARILPCLVILVSILSALHLMGAKGYAITHSNQSLPRTIFAALGFHLNWYEGQTGWLPGCWDVLWSLSVEEVFYLCFPLTCLLLRKGPVLLITAAILALSLPVSRAALVDTPIWQEKAYLPGMAGIAMGVFGGIVANAIRHPRPWSLVILRVFGISGLVAILFFSGEIWPVMGNNAFLLLTFSTICLVLDFHWQADQSPPRPIPYTGWLRSFGRLSYEIYLTHMFIVFTTEDFFKISGRDLRWGILWYIPTLILAWLTGWVVARCISIPAEQAVRHGFSSLTQTNAYQ